MELDESLVETLPPSQYRRMHEYADDHAFVFTEIVRASSVDNPARP